MATRHLKTVEQALDELPTGLALLRQPFPDHQISKLPKPTKKDAPKGKCKRKSDGGDAPDWQDHFCGGYHGLPAVHLDYVGHAALTDRLLDCDPNWSWEPMGTTPEGLPAINGGLWIKLTVCGVSRYGYGAADGKQGGDAIKEMIGDALRNAAMRFGAALDLWHKGDLHVDDDDKGDAITTGEDKPGKREKLPDLILKDGTTVPAPYPYISHLMPAAKEFVRTLNSFGDAEEMAEWGKTEDVKLFLAQLKRDLPGWWGGGHGAPGDWVPIEIQISQKKRDLEQIAGLKERV
jgi:hypothetical protein